MVRLDMEKDSLVAGRYRLQQHLGEGGMGTVWSAVHVVTRRAVALKFLRAELQHRPELRQRFLHEARAASALHHPNVIEVLDVFDLEDQSPAMVMELLTGETLGAKLRRDERLSVEETAALLLPVIDAVACAHEAGIVHRDLKPENIFLARAIDASLVKVLDFGIAKLSVQHYIDQSQVAVTEAGCLLGTPRYMAPEQISNQGVDQRADIWSLGTVLYECLSGVRPIEGDNLAEVMGRLMGGVIVPLGQLCPELPPQLSSAVQHMLARDPARRAADLDEITRVLEPHAKLAANGQGAASPPAPTRRVRLASVPAHGDGLASVGHIARDSTASRLTQPSYHPPPPDHGPTPGSAPYASEGRPLHTRLWLAAACLLLVGIGLYSMFAGGRSSPPLPFVERHAAIMETSALPSPSPLFELNAPPVLRNEVRSAGEEPAAPAPLPVPPRRPAPRSARPESRLPAPAGRHAQPDKQPSGAAHMDEASLFSGRK
jgi:serine/threonine protein kinase